MMMLIGFALLFFGVIKLGLLPVFLFRNALLPGPRLWGDTYVVMIKAAVVPVIAIAGGILLICFADRARKKQRAAMPAAALHVCKNCGLSLAEGCGICPACKADQYK
ncbi:MAG: hypothetical protein LBS18_02640 [Clostridiales bacterium]|jgi:hypothetical protein|nr:hypothetical protein [Clostridiales bacterium]